MDSLTLLFVLGLLAGFLLGSGAMLLLASLLREQNLR